MQPRCRWCPTPTPDVSFPVRDARTSIDHLGPARQIMVQKYENMFIPYPRKCASTLTARRPRGCAIAPARQQMQATKFALSDLVEMPASSCTRPHDLADGSVNSAARFHLGALAVH